MLQESFNSGKTFNLNIEMSIRFNLYKFVLASFGAFVFSAGCVPQQPETSSDHERYEIATPEYVVLAEKSLDLFASFEFESFVSMLSEDVLYEFPDGQKLTGKTALIDYWEGYKKASGIESMNIINANYLPIDMHLKPKGDENTGVKVIADFTNRMSFDSKAISVKMTFCFHFNQAKMIDRIITYYDQTPIVKALGRDYIQKAAL